MNLLSVVFNHARPGFNTVSYAVFHSYALYYRVFHNLECN